MALNKRSLSQKENTRELLFGNSTNICPLQVYSNAVSVKPQATHPWMRGDTCVSDVDVWSLFPMSVSGEISALSGRPGWEGRKRGEVIDLGKAEEESWSSWEEKPQAVQVWPGVSLRETFSQQLFLSRNGCFNQGFCFFKVIKSPDAALVPVYSLQRLWITNKYYYCNCMIRQFLVNMATMIKVYSHWIKSAVSKEYALLTDSCRRFFR